MAAATNWNEKKFNRSLITDALKSYEDKNSETETSHENWSKAMRALESNFDDAFGRAIQSLNDGYKGKK
ncbi:hypothetical protein ND856_14050 [Leptospira bandrabouensis]|uniref:hypothetical protein n=1 Tax=Leptospira bandrabouensis TaxID=2484903 RepID=UPI00223D3ECE|nr:hypothetical protein [Leptospira bandrabouensis]MCW7459569.1 hypothetical protein [Leptospira bandrabouensis]MCW7478413.1 hypothetical protein [Leptospira bandrabouensis]MCW7486303.1 hypothetical protein [Leptospira bandrabouensis]